MKNFFISFPCTGHKYVDGSALIILEFVNENSLAEVGFSGRLPGGNTIGSTGTLNDIPPTCRTIDGLIQ